MRLEFSLDKSDGSLFKRFSRNLDIEAWLIGRDLDGERHEVVCIPVKFNPYIFHEHNTDKTAGEVMEKVIDAVNKSLRLAETELEVITATEEED